MFFDRRECLSVFIFSVCLHYSLWTPSEMLCALHHWTAGKGAASDPRMPVGHQHGVAGEVKEIAFIFIFLQCWKTVVWRVILFFLVFHYHVISSLPSFISCKLPQVAWAVAVHWCLCGGGSSRRESATLCSPALNWGMLNVVYILNIRLASGTTSKSSSYLSISKNCPFCEWSWGRVQQLALFSGTNPGQLPLFCQQSLPPWFFQLNPLSI